MKLWLTGSRGMLGQAFARELRSARRDYVATDAELDVSDARRVLEFVGDEGFTHIVNCAAYTAVDQAEDEPELAERINAEGAACLARAAERLRACLLHFSTDYVFDGDSETPYSESAPCNPMGQYGRSKWHGEQAILKHSTSGYIVRTSWLFGDDGKNFVKTMVRLMREREELRVVDDQVGRPTYATDLARAALHLSGVEPQSKAASFGLYHFANSGITSWYGLAAAIHRRLSAQPGALKLQHLERIPTAEYPTRATRPAYSVLDTSKIEDVLGEKPRHWELALLECLDRLGST